MKIGKVSDTILKRSVININDSHNDSVVAGAGIAKDVSCIDAGDKYVLSATALSDCKRVSAAGFAVLRAANNIYAWGGKPVSVSTSIVMPEKYSENKLKMYVRSIIAACKKVGAALTGGHTSVSSDVTVPIISVTVTGFAEKKIYDSLGKVEAKMDIVVTKWIGIEEMLILLEENKEDLLSRLPLAYVEGAAKYEACLSVESEAAVAGKHGVAAMHDVSLGGIFAALWDFAEMAKCGFSVDLTKIPVLQETIEFCEVFDINPYKLPGMGSLLIATKDGDALVTALNEADIEAVVIGQFSEDNDKKIINGDEIRYLDKP